MTVPLIGLGDTARARRADPVSSHEAADATAHLVSRSHRLVERILEDHGRPMTQLEIEDAAVFLYGWDASRNRVRSAVAELEGVRTVRDGFTRPPKGQRRRQLWKLADV